MTASEPQCDPDMEVGAEEAKSRNRKKSSGEEEEAGQSEPKRRKMEISSQSKQAENPDGGETPTPQKEEAEQRSVAASTEDQKPPCLKRPLSRQSSRDSTRSSSPSSGCSTATLTRHAHHKRTYENRHPAAKRKPADASSEAGREREEEEDGEERKEEGGHEEELTNTTSSSSSSRRRGRSSSSCSSDCDSDGSREELRLTRAAKRRLQNQERERGVKERKAAPRAPSGADRNASNATEAPEAGEPLRGTRKSGGPQDAKPQSNSAPSLPPEPEVLGKRCSALNAAAKLLAMKGRVDTPGHTPRKDPGSKVAADKNQNPKSKSAPSTPQSNSVCLTNSKPSGGKPSTSNQTSRSASRSTRQCPGSLVPPLDLEYKRSKPSDAVKSGEADARSSSRGRSVSSSDGEGGGGGERSSRSRSSSNSSQRTLSSQNTERRSSRAASSGSERDRDRSLERARREGRGYRESRRSQRFLPEAAVSTAAGGGVGADGTPDRVLRSVAALAAVQNRSPAASTRSSASQQRHNKT